MKITSGSILAIIFLVLNIGRVSAQENFESQYLQGKDLLNKGRYSAAMTFFKPLCTEQEGNRFVTYAQYFFGLSAMKAGQLIDSRNMLLLLTNNYPEWEKIEEAYYLLANVSFEQNKYKVALKYLQDRNKDLKEDVDKMKSFYLQKVKSIDTLVAYQKDFPTDPVLAKVIFERLSYLPAPTEKQKMLLEYLAQEFKLEKKKSVVIKESEIKPSYNVAVLFPFLLKEFNANSAGRPNQFVFDLYEGLKLSVDSLKKAGVTINLYAYDTEKSEIRVDEILKMPEMKSMDLIIGPIYPAHNQLVNDFGFRNKILVVNPLSGNPSLVDANPFVYLWQPTPDNVVRNASNFAAANFVKDEKIKNVIILQSPTAKDSLLARNYKDSIIAKGFLVKYHEVISRDNMKRVQEILSDSIMLTTVSHILVSTNDQVLAANIISAMEISGFSIPMFASGDWLQFPLLTYDQYERREVHFLYPDFIDYGKEAVVNYRRLFFANMNALPLTNHAFQGYDLMRFWGMLLSKFGNFPVAGLVKTGFVPGYVLTGTNYSFGQSNSFVPITKFTESKLELLNYPVK